MRVQVPPSAPQDPHLRVFFYGENPLSAGKEAERDPDDSHQQKVDKGGIIAL